jgi:hypothetical protein
MAERDMTNIQLNLDKLKNSLKYLENGLNHTENEEDIDWQMLEIAALAISQRADDVRKLCGRIS